MDKVWFKLRQTHYPPPPETAILQGCTGAEAPICLGHVVEDLRTIDFALNADTIAPFPGRVSVFKTTRIDFEWDDTISKIKRLDQGASAPVATDAGVTLGGSIKLAFSNSVGNHESYEKLDMYIVQPTQSYVTDCLEVEPLAKYLQGRRRWSLFMITGLCVARKGVASSSESHGRELGLGVEVDVPTMVGLNVDNAYVNENLRTIAGTHTGDFVWAVRLAKIHKSLLNADWSLGPYTKRATFGAEEEEVDISKTLSEESMEAFTVVEDEDLDLAFVI